MATGGAPPVTTTVTGIESALVQLRVNYDQFMEVPAGEALHSDVVSIGGQLWRIDCYPRGTRQFVDSYVSIFLRNLTKYSGSSPAKAIFEPFFLASDGSPPRRVTDCESTVYHLHHHPALRKHVVDADGHITFLCAIVVTYGLGPVPVPVPPTHIRGHLCHMLDDEETSDVSFVVDGEIIHAHRAVLAARSPVFKAMLFGSMVEATETLAPITVHEIAPATFRTMLWFIYTDAWPEEDDSPLEMFQDLLAAADRYALDRLKLMCARKLWDIMSMGTVATIMACAETYGCPELKEECLQFIRIYGCVSSTQSSSSLIPSSKRLRAHDIASSKEPTLSQRPCMFPLVDDVRLNINSFTSRHQLLTSYPPKKPLNKAWWKAW